MTSLVSSIKSWLCIKPAECAALPYVQQPSCKGSGIATYTDQAVTGFDIADGAICTLEVTRKAPIMPTSSPSHATAPANDLPVRGPKLDATSLDRERASLSHIQSLRQFAQYVNNSSRRDPASDQPEAHSPRKGPPSSQASTDVASVLGLEQVNISAAPSEVSGTSAFTFPNLNHLKMGGQATKQIAVARHCPDELKPPPGSGWDISDYMMVKKLYAGNVSAVVKALHKPSGRVLAVKVYRRGRMHDMERYQLAREICLHVRIHHPNIVQLYAAWKDSKHVYLVLQYCEGGNLLDHLVTSRHSMSEADVSRRVLRPLLSSLAFMHSRELLHRDIKLENILLDGSGQVKLADFGLSIDRRHEAANTRLGTYGYFAPEVLRCQLKSSPFDAKSGPDAAGGYDSKVDVWSLGVLAYEVLVGKAPFAAASPEGILEAIKHRKLTYPQWLTPAAKDFLKQALQRDPAQRPTARQLLSHPFITLHNAMGRRRLSAPVGCPKAAALLLLAQSSQGAGTSAAQAGVRT